VEDWRHRAEKRGRAGEIIKASAEYLAYCKARPVEERLEDEPRTPEAADRTVSKRRWEQEVQQWRAGLRQWCSGRSVAAEEHADAAALEAPQRRQPSVLELLRRQGKK